MIRGNHRANPSLVANFCRELDVSCNKLEALPPEIGKCCRLRKIRANGNYMTTIPEEIGHCALLEVNNEAEAKPAFAIEDPQDSERQNSKG